MSKSALANFSQVKYGCYIFKSKMALSQIYDTKRWNHDRLSANYRKIEFIDSIPGAERI